MGAELAKAATALVLPLLSRDSNARVVLLVMANTALDDDTDPAYWAGSDSLAYALGYGHTCRDSGMCSRRYNGDLRMSCDPAGERAVLRALRHLERVGAIAQMDGPRTHNRRWLLRRGAWPVLSSPVDNSHTVALHAGPRHRVR